MMSLDDLHMALNDAVQYSGIPVLRYPEKLPRISYNMLIKHSIQNLTVNYRQCAHMLSCMLVALQAVKNAVRLHVHCGECEDDCVLLLTLLNEVDRRFRGAYCLNSQGHRPATSVYVYETTGRSFPKGCNFRRELTL
jgi:hypothetical protein